MNGRPVLAASWTHLSSWLMRVARRIIPFLVASLLLIGSPLLAEEISLTLLGDTYVDRDDPDSNFGSDDRLDAHYGIIGTRPEGGAHYLIRSMMLQFSQDEIDAIPDGSTINSAILEAYMVSADASDRVYMDVAVVDTDWSESDVTWNSLADRYLFPRSPRLTSHMGSSGWMQWDITRVVRHWKSGFYENHGLLLMIYLESGTAIEDYSRIFHSQEGDASRAPRLTVEYSSTPPETNVDLTITNLEINQVVQTLDDIGRPMPGVDNSVPLIAEKPTVVRAFVDVGPAGDSVSGVTAYLYRVSATADERIGPMAPITAVPTPDREIRLHSINFRLPEDWLRDFQQLYVVVNPSTLSMRVPENDYTNNRFPADGSFVNATFEGAGRAADVAWTRLNYTWSGWTGAAMADGRVGERPAVNLLRAVFPLAPHNVQYRFWPGGNIDWAADINANNGYDFRDQLNSIYDLSKHVPTSKLV